MVDKKLSDFSQVTPAEIAKLICLYLDQNNAIKNGVVDFATLNALLAHKAGDETFTGNKTFAGSTVFSGNATFNNTINANISGSSASCTGNSATATKSTQDGNGNNISSTYATKTELTGKVDLNLDNMNPSQTAKETIVGWGMPSSTYDDLTLGASGATYEAPADGYFAIAKMANAANQYVYMGGGISTQIWSSVMGQYLQTFLPVKKGQEVEVSYTAGGSLAFFRFYYCKGEENV